VPEEDEETLNPYFDLSKKTTEEMLKFAIVDRLASKKRVKNLRDLCRAPNVVKRRHQWFNYF
jgi:hypothetical protein